MTSQHERMRHPPEGDTASPAGQPLPAEAATDVVGSDTAAAEVMKPEKRGYFFTHITGRHSLSRSVFINLMLIPQVLIAAVFGLRTWALALLADSQPFAGLTVLLVAMLGIAFCYMAVIWAVLGATFSAMDHKRKAPSGSEAKLAFVFIAVYVFAAFAVVFYQLS